MAIAKQQELDNSFIDALVEEGYQASKFNTAVEMQKAQDKENDIYNQIAAIDNELAILGGKDPARAQVLYKLKNKLYNDLKTIKKPRPSYFYSRNNIALGKNGIKLVPKNCKGGKVKCGGKLKK